MVVDDPKSAIEQAVGPNVGLLGPITLKPNFDYLVLGMCVDPKVYGPLKDLFAVEEIKFGDRLSIRSSKIWLDARQVGHIVGAQGASSKWGRKLQFNFSGEWFRSGLSDRDAFALIYKFQLWVSRELPEVDAAGERMILDSLPVVSEMMRRWLKGVAASREAGVSIRRDEVELKQLVKAAHVVADQADSLYRLDEYEAADRAEDELSRLRDQIRALEERIKRAQLQESISYFERAASEARYEAERVAKTEQERYYTPSPGWRDAVDPLYARVDEARRAGNDLLALELHSEAAFALLQAAKVDAVKQGFMTQGWRPERAEEMPLRRAKTLEALAPLKGKLFINFMSIDRVDYVLEARCSPRPEWKKKFGFEDQTTWATGPIDFSRRCMLGDGWYFSDKIESADGESVYAASTANPRANRGTHPHICVYQKMEHRYLLDAEGRPAPIMRLEVRIPNVRPTTDGGSIDGAAYIAAKRFAECLARPFVAATQPDVPRCDYVNFDNVVFPVDMSLKQDDGTVLNDHVLNVPYGGHAKDTLKRLAKQACTLFERTIAGAINAVTYGASAGVDSQTGEEISLNVDKVYTVQQIAEIKEVINAYNRYFEPCARYAIDGDKQHVLDQRALKFESRTRATALAWVARYARPKPVEIAPGQADKWPDFYAPDVYMEARRAYEAGERARVPRWGHGGPNPLRRPSRTAAVAETRWSYSAEGKAGRLELGELLDAFHDGGARVYQLEGI